MPNRIYKYRDFSNRTLEMVVNDSLYYAHPSTFNDPLECHPLLETDLNETELEKILRNLVKERVRAKMSVAAKTMKLNGPKMRDYIERHSHWEADKSVAEVEYNATNPDYDSGDAKNHLFRHSIETELRQQYDRGVVSFAEQETCPLMWSHYGSQHRGICIGYSVPDAAKDELHKVRYGGSRLVKASQVSAMLDESDIARAQVDEAVLLRKAENWSYEQEWRLIGRCGVHDSPLELEEIVFGMRCSNSTKYAVMRALEGRDKLVKFYEMRADTKTFDLEKEELCYDDQLFVEFPRRSLTTIEAFQDFSAEISSAKAE